MSALVINCNVCDTPVFHIEDANNADFLDAKGSISALCRKHQDSAHA